MGSKPMKTRSITYRRYDKQGDLQDALHDFYAFKPYAVKEYKSRDNKVNKQLNGIGC